jgi:CubicO group peptidase (beta-lactamase class C family)
MIEPSGDFPILMPSPSMINKLLVCFALIAASVTSVRVAAQTPAERFRNELQPLIEDFVHQQQIPGFAIGVIQDDRLVYTHGFGVKNLAHNQDPVTPRSLFHMASITKTFVATSIMQLVEVGKINLDTPVASFEDYVQHHILTPLKMKDSTLLIKKTNPKLMTWGYERDKDGHLFPTKVYPYNRMHSPSSNLHSNVEDMARWALANLNHGELDSTGILKEQTYDIMWKPAHKLSDSDSVGISWFLGEYRGQATVSHGGGDIGYATFLVLLPEKKIAVVLMANCDWLGKGRGQIANAALDVALGLKPEPIAVAPSPR